MKHPVVPDQPRTEFVGVRFTPDEKDAITAAADLLNMPLSAWIRDTTMARILRLATETRN